MTTSSAPSSAVPTCPHFDPFAPDQIADPYPLYARLHQETPVFYSPQYDLWIVTRYADISAALKRHDVFTTLGGLRVTGALPPSISARLDELLGGALMMAESEPPMHGRLRGVLSKAFTPQRIAQLEPQIREIVDQLIDGFVGDGRADLIRQFAIPLPGQVICDLFGVPRADMWQLKRWSDDYLELLLAMSPEERLRDCLESFAAYQRYVRAQLEARRAQPGDDLLSVMLPQALGGDAPLTLAEALYNGMGMLVAGHETTTHAIGNGVMLLLAHPEQRTQLAAQPALLPSFVEEVLRIDSMVQGMFRLTTQPTELSGVTLPAGARVLLLYGAANHDAAEFPDPERFDPERPELREHLAFGRGIHVCLGAPLARLEMRIAFERLLARLPNLRLAPDTQPERLVHFSLRGYQSLPIAWDPPAA